MLAIRPHAAGDAVAPPLPCRLDETTLTWLSSMVDRAVRELAPLALELGGWSAEAAMLRVEPALLDEASCQHASATLHSVHTRTSHRNLPLFCLSLAASVGYLMKLLERHAKGEHLDESHLELLLYTSGAFEMGINRMMASGLTRERAVRAFADLLEQDDGVKV